jgi:hypothetical protein
MTDRLKIAVPDDYEPAEGELNNIVYLCCKYGVEWSMRTADFAVCKMMAGSPVRGAAGISKLVEVTCEYLWDHVCGEPGSFTPESLYEHLRPMLETWYAETDRAEREDVGPAEEPS